MDESLVAFPFGEPVTGQGRWGPLAVDESLVAFPFGEGGPLAVDEKCLCQLLPSPRLRRTESCTIITPSNHPSSPGGAL
ncbi:MAG TPA: hypothetical protein PLH64_08405 [Anaerolineaceae bacterium]|nr:hypothetical protein [Anaerolineaceae bacterium]